LKDIAALLLSHGADPNARTTDDAYDAGQTPLHRAAYAGHADIVELLIEKGADVNRRDTRGRSPLHHAAHCGHTSVVSLLRENEAEIGVRDHQKRTPLDRAKGAGFADIVALLGGEANDPSLANRTHSTIIIPNARALRQVLDCNEFDGAWVPEEADLEGLPSVLKRYLREACVGGPQTHNAPEHVLANLRRYHRENAGFVRDDVRYIACNMVITDSYDATTDRDHFTWFLDAWWRWTTVVFDARDRSVIRIECH
jgi:hypothetical protein